MLRERLAGGRARVRHPGVRGLVLGRVELVQAWMGMVRLLRRGRRRLEAGVPG